MLKKRSFSLSRHRTSVALEPEFWTVLESEKEKAGISLAIYIAEIDRKRGLRPLASALRLNALAAVKKGP
jgi:predicted DNA-binding ribbon-helix-helix protein